MEERKDDTHQLGAEKEKIEIETSSRDLQRPSATTKKEKPACADPNIPKGAMLKELLQIAVPSMAFMLANYGTQTVTMGYVGHRMGVEGLAQFVVGLSLFNVFGASLGFGITAGLDTLAPQAYGRDNHTKEFNDLFQRATVVNLLMMVPLTVIYLTIQPILDTIYSPNIAAGAGEFLRGASVYCFLLAECNAMFRLFTAQHLAHVPFFCNLAGAIFAVALNHYMLPSDGTGTVTHVMILLTTIQAGLFACLVGSAILVPQSIMQDFYKGGLASWQRAFTQREKIREYLVLGFHSFFAIVSVWWGFEILQVIAAQMEDDVAVVILTLLQHTLILYFAIGAGASIGGATMLGNCLGANEPELAKKYVLLNFQVCSACSCVTTSSLFFFGLDILGLYTKDPEVLDRVRPLACLLTTWHFLDTTQTAFQSLFRGAGEQHVNARIAFITLWIIGAPCAYFFGVKLELGVVGIIGGQCIGLVLMGPWLLRKVLAWNYEELALRAQDDD